MSGTEFSNERPKGNAWGIEDAVSAAVKEFMKTGRSAVIPIIGAISIKTVKVVAGEDGPVFVPVVAVKRINALGDPESIKVGQRLILKAIADLEGPRGVDMLPFDEKETITSAFGGLNAEEVERDDQELAEDQMLTDPDRLRRHLTIVHGFAPAEIAEMETVDVQRTHQAAHNPLAETVMPHDVEWWEWRRIILTERAAELTKDGITWGDDAPEVTETEPMDDEAELRAHLAEVHEFADDLIGEETLADLRQRHVNDHDNPPDEGFPVHDVAWLGHTKDELDAAEATAEDDTTAQHPADAEE